MLRQVRDPHNMDYTPKPWPESPRTAAQRAPWASNGPDHFGLCALRQARAAMGERLWAALLAAEPELLHNASVVGGGRVGETCHFADTRSQSLLDMHNASVRVWWVVAVLDCHLTDTRSPTSVGYSHVGETCRSAAPPSSSSRCSSRDAEGGASRMNGSPTARWMAAPYGAYPRMT